MESFHLNKLTPEGVKGFRLASNDKIQGVEKITLLWQIIELNHIHETSIEEEILRREAPKYIL